MKLVPLRLHRTAIAVGLALALSYVGFCRPQIQAAEPLKVLLITGGCCHDYQFQTDTLKTAFQEHKVDVQWTVVNEGGSGTEAEIARYDNPDWAKGYDAVIHNECFANTTSPEYIRKITQAHEAGVNAVVIHCAMHT